MPAGQSFALGGLLCDGSAAACAALDGGGWLLALGGGHGSSKKSPPWWWVGYVAICRCIRRAIQAATGIAQLFPNARYLGPSGHSLAGFLRHGIAV